MAFRFRRSIKILPGIRINIGKRSISTSIGERGAQVTLRPGRTARTTVGLPGTGISYTEGGESKTSAEHKDAAHASVPNDSIPEGKAWRGWLWVALAIAIGAAVCSARANLR